MADPSPVDLPSQRLIQAAKGGERRALALLWDGCVDTLWSIARVLSEDEVQAMLVLASLREELLVHAPGLSISRPWRKQAVEALYVLLNKDFEDLNSVMATAGPARIPWTPSASGGLEHMRVELRAVFVFHLLGGLSVAEIAGLLAVEEMTVRGARTWVSYRMVRADQERA
ncbi:MAG: hypothetical protein ACI9VR_001549 [Cognaticolwellia sp.]|jgi:hypothetical protein